MGVRGMKYTIQQIAKMYGMSLPGMRYVILAHRIEPAEVKPRGQKLVTRLYDERIFEQLEKLGYTKKQEG